MQFLFYNSFDFPVEKYSAYKRIWLPRSNEINLFIRFLSLHYKDVQIACESCFTSVLHKNNSAQIIEYAPQLKKDSNRKIVFYSQSDTLSKSVLSIIKNLNADEYVLMIPQNSTEGAEKVFQANNLQYHSYSYQLLKSLNPSVLVLLNDWAKEAQRIISHCRILNIPSVCIQESIIDFGDNFKRMQHADNAFVQGIQTIKELDRDSYFITGNPRYENISRNITDKPKALINCNFTYNIFEEIRNSWLNDIVTELEKNNIDYIISQHPRDNGDLSSFKNVIRSSAEVVQQQIAECSFVITRFSSLVHEALVAGKKVVYYNPHGENMQYNFGFNDSFLQLAKTKTELNNALKNISGSKISVDAIDEYLSIHCIQKSNKPSLTITHLLRNFTFRNSQSSIKDFYRIIFYYPTIISVFRAFKKIFSNK